MSKKREAPPKPEELIQKLSEKLEVVKGELTAGLEETKSQVGEKGASALSASGLKSTVMHTHFFKPSLI